MKKLLAVLLALGLLVAFTGFASAADFKVSGYYFIEGRYVDANSLAKDAADEADMTVKELNACAERLEKLGNKLEKAKVTKGYELTVTVNIEGKDEDDEYEDLILRVIKVNGDWMIDFTSLDDSSALDLILDIF